MKFLSGQRWLLESAQSACLAKTLAIPSWLAAFGWLVLCAGRSMGVFGRADSPDGKYGYGHRCAPASIANRLSV